MFNISRNRQSAVDKAVQKALDPKRDVQARMKHLKELLSLPSTTELCERMHEHKEAFLDTFLNAFRATDVWHKSQKSTKNVLAEYDLLLSVLEKLFAAMPDAFGTDRWQEVELVLVFKKLLHPASSSRIRQDSIRCFLLYYCILGHDAGADLHRLFKSIVPARNYPGTSNIAQLSSGTFGQSQPTGDHTKQWALQPSASTASIVSSKSTPSTVSVDHNKSIPVARAHREAQMDWFFDGVTPIVVPHQNEKPLHIRQQNALEVLLLELIKTTDMFRSLRFTVNHQEQSKKADPSTTSAAVHQLSGEAASHVDDNMPSADNNNADAKKQQHNPSVVQSLRLRSGAAAFQFLYDQFKRIYAARIVPGVSKFIPFFSISNDSTSPTLRTEFSGNSSLSSASATPPSSSAASPPPVSMQRDSKQLSFENSLDGLPTNEDEDPFPLMSAILAQFLCSVLLRTSHPLRLPANASLSSAKTLDHKNSGQFSLNGRESFDTIMSNFSPLTHSFKFDDENVADSHLSECAAVLVADEDDQLIVHAVIRHVLRHGSTALSKRFEVTSPNSSPGLSPTHAACLVALIIELYKMWLVNKKSVALPQDLTGNLRDAAAAMVSSSPEEFAFVQSLLQTFYNNTSVVFFTPVMLKHSTTASTFSSKINASPKRTNNASVSSSGGGHEASLMALAATKFSRGVAVDSAAAATADQQQRLKYYPDHLQVWQRLLETFRMPIMHMDMSLKTWNVILSTLLKVLQATMPSVDERLAASTLAGRVASTTSTIGAAGQWWLRCGTNNISAADNLLMLAAEKVTLFDTIARHLVQAIMVAYVKAAIYVPIRPELWDELKMVLSGSEARHSPDVVEQWARIMVTLTRVLCREIYGIALVSAETGAAASMGITPGNNTCRLASPTTITIKRPAEALADGRELPLANSSPKTSLRARPVRFSDPPPRTPTFPKEKHRTDEQHLSGADAVIRAVNRQDLLSSSDGAVSSDDELRSATSTSSSHTPNSSNAAVIKLRRWSSSPKDPPDSYVSSKSTLFESDHLSLDASESLAIAKSATSTTSDADDVVAVEMGRMVPAIVTANDEEEHFPSTILVVEDEADSQTTTTTDSWNTIVTAAAPASENETVSTSHHHAFDDIEHVQQRMHVMAGGTIRGWTPEAVCVVWHRMLGILGNLSETASTSFIPEAASPSVETTSNSIGARLSASDSGNNNANITCKTNEISIPPEHHELIMRSLDNFAQYLVRATDEQQKEHMLKQQRNASAHVAVSKSMQKTVFEHTAETPAPDIDREDSGEDADDNNIVADEAVADEDVVLTVRSKSDAEFELLEAGSRVAAASPSSKLLSVAALPVVVQTVVIEHSNVHAAQTADAAPTTTHSAELATLRALPPSYAVAALVIEVLDKFDSRPAYIKSVIVCYKLLGQILFGNAGGSGDNGRNVPGAPYLTHFYRIVHRALTIVGGGASNGTQQQLEQQALLLETVLLHCVLKLLRLAPPQAGVLIDDILYGCERLLLLTRQLSASMPSSASSHQRSAFARANEQRTALVLNVVAATAEVLERVDVQRQRVFQPSNGIGLHLVPLKPAASEKRIVCLLTQVCDPEFDGSTTDEDSDLDEDDFAATMGVKRSAVLATSHLPSAAYSIAIRTNALYLSGVQLLRLLMRLFDDPVQQSKRNAKDSLNITLRESANTTMRKLDMLLGCVLYGLSDVNSVICNAAVDTLNLIAWQFLPALMVKASLMSHAFAAENERSSSSVSNETDGDNDDDAGDALCDFFAVSVRNIVLCLCRNIQELSEQCLSTDFYAAHKHQHSKVSPTKSNSSNVGAADSTLKPNQQISEKKTSAGLQSARFSAEVDVSATTADDGTSGAPCVLLWRLAPMCLCLIDWVVQLPLPFLSQTWPQQHSLHHGSNTASKYALKSANGTLRATTGGVTTNGDVTDANLLREIESTFRALTFAEHKLSASGYAAAAALVHGAPASSATHSTADESALRRNFFSSLHIDEPAKSRATKAGANSTTNDSLQAADLTNSSSSRPSTTNSMNADHQRNDGDDTDGYVFAEPNVSSNDAGDSTNTGYFARRRATKKAAAAATVVTTTSSSYSTSSANQSDNSTVDAPLTLRRLPSTNTTLNNSRNASGITKPVGSARKHSRRSGGRNNNNNSSTINNNGESVTDAVTLNTASRGKSSFNAADATAAPSSSSRSAASFVRHSPRHQPELDRVRPSALFTFQRPSLMSTGGVGAAAGTSASSSSSRHGTTSKSSVSADTSSTSNVSSTAVAAANIATARVISLLGNYAFRYTLSWLNCDVNVHSLSCPGTDFAESDVLRLSRAEIMLNRKIRRGEGDAHDDLPVDAVNDELASTVADKSTDPSLLIAAPHTQWFTIHDVVFSITAILSSSSKADSSNVTSLPTLEDELLIPHDVTLHVFVRDLAGRHYWTLQPAYGFRAFAKQLQQRLDALNLLERPLERLAQHHKQLYEGWRHRRMLREKQADGDGRQNYAEGTSTDDSGDYDPYFERQRDRFAEIVELINEKCPEMGVLAGRTLRGASEATSDGGSSYLSEDLEKSLMKMLKQQRDRIDEFAAAEETDELVMAPAYKLPKSQWSEQAWLYACQFLSQFGYLGDRKRRMFYPLAKSAELVRDLRFLDKRNVRDYHKVGIIYVGPWQESKSNIMQNERGSALFSWFLEQLGWRVELEAHRGYMGGLPRSQTQSTSVDDGENGGVPRFSVYFAAPSVEVMTHVSTMIPLGGQQSGEKHDYTSRMRHIGNDAVVVVWSENWRDYDRNTIRTNFADVIICVYPLVDAGLFRVSVVKKPSIPSFGPLQPPSGSGGEAEFRLLDASVLGPLVRATMINASRAVRAAMPNWQWFFEERAVYLANVISKHTSIDTPAGLMRTLLGLAADDGASGARTTPSSVTLSKAASTSHRRTEFVADGTAPIAAEDSERAQPHQLPVTHILEHLRAHGSLHPPRRAAVVGPDEDATASDEQSFSQAELNEDEFSSTMSLTRGRSRSEGEVSTPPPAMLAAPNSSAADTATVVPSSSKIATVGSTSTTTTTSSYLRELLHSKRRHPS